MYIIKSLEKIRNKKNIVKYSSIL